jgi:nitrogenase molybdenum-iron protein alpha/beta subunit
MKKILIIAGIIFFAIYLLNESKESKTSETKSNQGNVNALKEIRKEAKVKEALITEAGVLYVSVVDDGTNRNGYASYLCEILREKNAEVNRVKIIKVNSTKDPNRDNAYGILLGESLCK